MFFLSDVGPTRFMVFFLVADLCEGTFFACHISHCPVCVPGFFARIVFLGFADLVGLREDAGERVVREVGSLTNCLGALPSVRGCTHDLRNTYVYVCMYFHGTF